jgi:hypothetical protein
MLATAETLQNQSLTLKQQQQQQVLSASTSTKVGEKLNTT